MDGVISDYNIPRKERMHPLTHKLKKYKNKVKDEPVDFRVDPKKEWRQNQKRRYTDIVLSRLNMKGRQKTQAYFLVEKLDFKYLCGKCSMEQIITTICMYVKFSNTKKRQIRMYSICNDNKVNESIYAAIVTRIAAHFQKQVPLPVQ